MADFAIKFSDWSGGDSGIDDTDRPSQNTYKGRNVVQYRSGLLGPRAGWKHRGNTSFVGAANFFDTLSGPTAGAPGTLFIAVMHLGSDTYAYVVNAAAATVASLMSAGAGGSTSQGVTIDNKLYLIVSSSTTVPTGMRAYTYNPSGPSLSAVTVTLPEVLRHVASAGLFLVGVSHASPWRIRFSELSPSGPTYTSWPANNFYDIGDTIQPITALHWVGNALYVGKRNGWWSVTGVLGEQVTIRQVSSDPGPKAWGFSTVRSDGRISYVNPDGYAAVFNGERVQTDRTRRYFDYPTTTTETFFRLRLAPSATALPSANGVAFFGLSDTLPIASGSNRSLQVLDQRGWAGHSGGTIHVGDRRPLAPRDLESFVSPTGVLFTLANESNQMASWEYLLDRPAHASDAWGAPEEYVTPGLPSPGLVSGEVLFPAWFDPQGRQVRVKSVIIQFRKWTSGVADSMNKLQCQIVRAGAYEGGESSSTVQEWTEASASATDDGTDDSVRFGFGEQGWGNGFRLRIPVMQGVAIREIVAQVDIRTTKT